MSETLTPPASGGSTTPVKPSRTPRADYDQKLANDITEAGTLIGNALENPAVLAELSYSEAEVQAGLALQVAAQNAFTDRQNAQGTASARRRARDLVLTKVTDEFRAFRTTVRSTLPASALTPLGASGRLPVDLQKLITLVRSAYETARTPAYLPALEQRKITGPILAARMVDAENLERLDGQFKAADKTATAATRVRDEAGDALRTWVSKFRKQVRSDLRRHPDLFAKLGI